MTGKKAALPVLLHYLLVIAALSMLVDVETFFLDSLVYTQTGNLVDAPEEEETHYCTHRSILIIPRSCAPKNPKP